MAKKEEQWSIDTLHANSARFKKLAKRYAGEFDSCMNNLNKIQVLLRQGQKIGSFKLGFFRSEGSGLYRVGQTGVRSAKELRVYVYFYQEENGVIYPITIGTKETQQDDINDAKKVIKKLR